MLRGQIVNVAGAKVARAHLGLAHEGKVVLPLNGRDPSSFAGLTAAVPHACGQLRGWQRLQKVLKVLC